MTKFSTVALALLLPGIVSAGVQVFEGFLSPDECQELLLDPVANLAPDKPLSFYEFKLEQDIYESLSETISSLDCDDEQMVSKKKNHHNAHVCSMMETTSLDPKSKPTGHDDCPVFAFCVLEDNDEAYFLDGNDQVPVEQGTLVVYSGDAVLHTVVPSGAKPVHVLGPFYITSTDTGRRKLGWGSWRKNYGHHYNGKGKGYYYSKGGGKGGRGKGGGSGGKSASGGTSYGSYGKSASGYSGDYSYGKSGSRRHEI